MIQPAEYDFEQSVWRNLFDLRLAIRDRTLDIKALRERLVTENETTDADIGESQLRTMIRETYGIPEKLANTDAELVVSEVLADIAENDLSTADDRLTEVFSTVCERKHPHQRETAAGHLAACHLHTKLSDTNTTESSSAADD